ncbi:MAG: glycosyltransferase [Calditrichaeota bacterium]|nr:glycosyltransferase [Calditrichota bacterium]
MAKGQKKGKKKRRTGRQKKTAESQSNLRPGISICMIVKDEEKHLPKCLESVKGLGAELVIVDTGSTDRTIEIARGYGARVFHFPWNNNFSDARNESLKHATKDWIIWLDADDRLPKSEHEKIRRLARQKPDRGFHFILRNQGLDDSRCFQLRMFPNHPDIRFEGAVHEQAASALKRLHLPIENTDVTLIHTGYATEEIVRAKKKKYVNMMEAWLADHPDDCLIQYQFALTNHTMDNHKRAVQEFEKFLSHSGCLNQDKNVTFYALILTGRSYLNLGNTDKALHYLLEAEKLNAQSDFLKMSLAEVYTNRSDPKKAIQYLESVGDLTTPQITFMPLDFSVLHFGQMALLASNWMKLGELEKARYYLEEAEKLKPERAEIDYYWGEWYERSGYSEKALSFYKQATQKSPETFLYHFKKGTLHLAMGDALHASQEYEMCQNLLPGKKEVLVNLGVLERNYGRLEKSEAFLKKALEKYSHDADVSYHYAQTLFDAGNYEGSLAILREGEPFRRTEKMVLLLLLNLFHLQKMNEFGQELEKFRTAFVPGIPGDQPGLSEGFFDLAYSYQQAVRPVEAELAYSLFIQIKSEPKQAEFQKWVEFQMKAFHLNAAISNLETLILNTKGSASLMRYFHYLSQCYASLGIREAVEMCRQKISVLSEESDHAHVTVHDNRLDVQTV